MNIKNEVSEIGPYKIVQIFFPVSGFRAVVVVDNIALGPSIGGVRVSQSVTLEEIKRLAGTMTLKNAIAGLPHGGGKAGIMVDPKDPQKEHCFRIFAQAIKDLNEYIPGPDMGSNEECMAWVYDEIGRAVGLPAEEGGLPLDRLGATGFGVAECAEVACHYAAMQLKGAKVAIQGFGSVGKKAAHFLAGKGALIVAVSDTRGCISDLYGIDVKKLTEVKDSTGSVINYRPGTVKKTEELFSEQCDILVPAANPDVIHKGNAGDIRAKLIIQGANIPATREAEELLHRKGILSIPDFIANAGGVIMAAMEHAGKTGEEAFDTISERIKKNTALILEKTFEENILPRQAAEAIARERVLTAMSYKRVL
ncbi:MAG: Glu/Leu/Phe/Val dehydrogenase [Nitrospirae bacterium]|nr:Glu/Leu/Phe/Val dehydrogenase [Nitrospirota bacterium]MCL5236996.1 Glu/Leu/Phe/Val dehydrogenase [Nitrospirota bacterium]